MRLLTIFARYGTLQYSDSDSRLRRELAEQIPGVARDFLVVDTALPALQDFRNEHGVHVLGSDNDYWEFGAWSTAIAYLGDSIYDYDYLLFTTSACFNGYIDFHRYLTGQVLELFRWRAVALGHIEVYNLPVYYGDVKFQAWLRSSYILLQPCQVVLVGDPVTVKNTDLIFSDNPEHPYLDNALPNAQYQLYIHSWLTGDGTGQGVTWHSRFSLNHDTFAYYKDKARAIFNEMGFSNRLVASGCSLVDMTWLHRLLASGAEVAAIPSWHAQLMQRGTGHESIVEG